MLRNPWKLGNIWNREPQLKGYISFSSGKDVMSLRGKSYMIAVVYLGVRKAHLYQAGWLAGCKWSQITSSTLSILKSKSECGLEFESLRSIPGRWQWSTSKENHLVSVTPQNMPPFPHKLESACPTLGALAYHLYKEKYLITSSYLLSTIGDR